MFLQHAINNVCQATFICMKMSLLANVCVSVCIDMHQCVKDKSALDYVIQRQEPVNNLSHTYTLTAAFRVGFGFILLLIIEFCINIVICEMIFSSV